MDSIGAFTPQAAPHWLSISAFPGSPPPALLAGSFEAGLAAEQMAVLVCAAITASADLVTLVRASGHRVLDVVPVPAAAAHLEGLISLDAVIVRCTGDEAGLAELLAKLDLLAESGQMALLVSVGFAGLERVHGLVRSRNTILLCEPCAEDLVAAIAALAERHRSDEHLHDIGAEAEGDRFERLNDQLLRLHRMIETLVQDRTSEEGDLHSWNDDEVMLKSPARPYQASSHQSSGPEQRVTAHQVRAVLRARRLRDHLVAADLFADPAWDILLDLLAARLENTQVSVSSLCIAAAVPPTTALRWIRHLTDRGLLKRQADSRDGRRIFIALSDSGMEAVVRWFQESRPHLQCMMDGAG